MPVRWRNIIKRIPVLGGMVRWAYRQARYVSQPGLSAKQRIRAIPGFGATAAWCYSVLFLNRIRQDIASQLLLRQQAEIRIQHSVGQLAKEMHAQAMMLEQKIEQQRIQIKCQQDMLSRLQRDADLQRNADLERDNRIAALTRSLRRMRQEQRMPAQTHAISPVASALDSAASKIDMNSFYIEFEGSFRGAREDIKDRLERAYRPYLTQYIGDPGAHAVDVGAGRGEWLELMREHGISAIGIDLDGDMVDACLQRGLDARVEDAVHYLARQSPGSVAIVSGFHIIEHLPFETLIALFDAALRALRPDGMIIFETPNPENLIVGSCNFYYDPTHLHPIVPAVGEFMARQRGFARAEILRLHPYPDSMQLVEDSEMARRINQLIYGPQDFAILAWKTNAN